MRAREIERLRRALAKVKVPRCNDGWYRWGRYAIKTDTHRVIGSWVDQIPEGASYMSRMTCGEVFESLLKELLQTITGLYMYSNCTIKCDRISIGLYTKGNSLYWLNPDSQIYNLAFGVFTGDVPHEMFHDALLHDTNILDEVRQ